MVLYRVWISLEQETLLFPACFSNQILRLVLIVSEANFFIYCKLLGIKQTFIKRLPSISEALGGKDTQVQFLPWRSI